MFAHYEPGEPIRVLDLGDVPVQTAGCQMTAGAKGGVSRMAQEQTTIRFVDELKEQIQREADGKGKTPEDSFASFWEKYPLKAIG